MILRPLVSERYSILGVVENGACDADDFISAGEMSEDAWRSGLRTKLRFIAQNGFQNVPDKWSHEVNKPHHIYELVHGKLRLFYFKGVNGQIAICTGGTRKQGKKVDPQMVSKAIRMKQEYFAANDAGTLRTED
ncbi:MAG: hypothetical protein J0653_08125 [Deltaproteobacteria bacterium]|nr:hypothetical protein [Deltaproteobacteria bacterium]